MGKIFNKDGSINQAEVDELVHELEESQRIREREINRREARIEEIDQEIERLEVGLVKMKTLDTLFQPSNMAEMITDIIIMADIENDVKGKIKELEKEREELSNKYTI